MLTYRILGPVDVLRDGRPLALGPAKQRALLACLLVRRGQTVPVGRLVEDLWDEDPPPSAEHQIHVYVSRLRKILGTNGRQPLVTRSPGYALEIAHDDEVDAAAFEERVRSARAGLDADPERAAAVLADALAAWRGPALADLRDEPFARPVATRLEELRTVAEEERISALLAVGRHADAIPELEALVADHPLRERLRELQMLALYRSGRQADALSAFENARRTLAEELGLDPGPGLRSLEAAILRHDEALARRPAPVAEPRAERPPTEAPSIAAGPGTPDVTDGGRRRWRALSIALTTVVAVAGAAATVWLVARAPTPVARPATRDRGETAAPVVPERLSWSSVPALDEPAAGAEEVVLGAIRTGSGYVACGTRRLPSGGGADYDLAVWTSARPAAGWVTVEGLHRPGNQRATDLAELRGRIVLTGWDSSTGSLLPAVWVGRADGGPLHRVSRRSPSLSLSTMRARAGRMRGLTVADGRLIAVGSTLGPGGLDATVWTSADGRDWVTPAAGGTAGPADTEMLDVAPAGRRVVAVGYAAAIRGGAMRAAVWTSDDGLKWDRAAVEPLPGWDEEQMSAVATGDDALVAVGRATRRGNADAAVWISRDGTRWRRVPDASLGGDGDQRMFSVAWSPGFGFVAAGDERRGAAADAVIWTSPDGRRWHRQAPNTASTSLTGPGIQIATVLVPMPNGLLALGVEGRRGSPAAHAWIGTWSST